MYHLSSMRILVTYFKAIILQFPQPYGFSYFMKCSFNNDLDKLRCFKGPNSSTKFIKNLIEDVNYLYSN